MSKSQPKRGRPTTVDTQAALIEMIELFRAKGFAAVSLDDLSSATGLSRPSLYRAFGDKLNMYIAAMDAFGVQVLERAVPKLHATEDVEAGLADFYAAMLSIYYRDAAMAPGCLVFGTAPSSADQAAVQDRLKSGITALDSMMRDRLKRAAPALEEEAIEPLVSLASNTLIAFSARAKSGASKVELVEMGRTSAHLIAGALKKRD
nr:TetR/AcrR family transcriptional regulator [Hyphomonas sp. Mor2]